MNMTDKKMHEALNTAAATPTKCSRAGSVRTVSRRKEE